VGSTGENNGNFMEATVKAESNKNIKLPWRAVYIAICIIIAAVGQFTGNHLLTLSIVTVFAISCLVQAVVSKDNKLQYFLEFTLVILGVLFRYTVASYF